MSKTAEGLVSHALAMRGSPYMWGTFGQRITDSLIDQKVKQYPTRYTPAYIEKLRVHARGGQKRAVDCVGLIKAYLYMETPQSEPVYRAEYDKNVSGMLAACQKAEDIKTLPEQPGVLLFQGSAHAGIYLGGGKVVEARGSAEVLVSELKSRSWDKWGRLKWISYDKAPPAAAASPAKENEPLAGEQLFVNRTGKLLYVYADTARKLQIGSPPAG
ncbi:MAG: C40 family peptidase, partial [Oscillospiraceae bacterium]|nr:C40 family peptidase [Oscillospiraceae bacterium]